MSTVNPIKTVKYLLEKAVKSADAVDISIGDRFEQSHHGLPVWIVERISRVEISQFPLISLRREDRPELQKIISLTALQDGIDYRPAG